MSDREFGGEYRSFLTPCYFTFPDQRRQCDARVVQITDPVLYKVEFKKVMFSSRVSV